MQQNRLSPSQSPHAKLWRLSLSGFGRAMLVFSLANLESQIKSYET